MFDPLPENYKFPELEEDTLKFWEENEIFEKSLDLDGERPYFTFYEGPPTVNGKPGIHHVMSRTIKDVICRYKTMQGYFVRRQAGWDTHGLPVEIAVQKELGIKDKREIETTFGIDKFNKACRDSVYKNIGMSEGWKKLTSRMGYWLDLDSAYITCTNDYVESVWWAIKQYFDKGLIYKGFKVVPQSPTIETPLSSHELSQNYQEVRDPSCYVKLKVTDSKRDDVKDAQLLVWTTTPWTLVGNVALAVGEDIEYVLVTNKRKFKEENLEDKLVLAKSRLAALDGEYEIHSEFMGTELLGTRYEQIFPFAEIDTVKHPNALSIVAGDFVTTGDGSGIVHMAPAFGEDDYRMSLEYNLPFIQHITPNGHFKEGYGEFSGRAIKNFTYEDGRKEEGADKDIVIWLKKADKNYRTTNDYLHNYPFCWRTNNPIMYYARESWFIKSPEYKEKLIELNKTINWQPPEVGAGRFGNWLEEVKDWSLSRDRFWGTPLPLWINENDPSDIFAVGSIAELNEGVYEKEDGTRVSLEESGQEVDLHRPFVDNVVFEKNGNTYRRVPEVIDVWFDSGSMPFAQMHYPFENKELFEKSFPADFIAEGVDQTRGWFYTLHNISTALFDKVAYKNIVVNDLILDKNGIKMSKSKGNTVDPFDVFNRIGADAVRWYFFVNNPPWRATLFNEEDISRTVISDFFRSLTNTYAFFALYANIDGYSGNEDRVDYEERPEIDKWILSKANSVLKEFLELMDQYELTKAHRLVQEFSINELSNWYIRRNRRRFWKGENDSDKIAAYQTLHEVLILLLSMTAPTAPFLADNIYRRLKTDSDPESIHLKRMPEVDESKIDSELERRMDIAQKVVFLSRSLRERDRLRTRQPLRRILVPVMNEEQKNDINLVADIIKEEINVKSIEFVSEETQHVITRQAKPNYKSLGKKHGKQTNSVANKVRGITNDDILALEKGDNIIFDIDGYKAEIEFDDIEITSEEIPGWSVATESGVTVALDTELSEDLINEGISREFVNRIQNFRKDSGFDVTDRIEISVKADDKIKSALDSEIEYIKNETLALELTFDDNASGKTESEIIEEKIFISIQKK